MRRVLFLLLLSAVPAYADDPLPQAVPINAIDKEMIAGERQIHLPPQVLQVMSRRGVARAIIAVKLCIGADGIPSTVLLAKSSGYDEADQNVVAKVKEWRFRPYRVDGKPVPVCTAVMFNYTIDDVAAKDAFTPLIGTWKCNGATSSAIGFRRAGAFVLMDFFEPATGRGMAVVYSKIAHSDDYAAAGSDNQGVTWTATSKTSDGGLSWSGDRFSETQKLGRDGSLELQGQLGASKWDLSCTQIVTR